LEGASKEAKMEGTTAAAALEAAVEVEVVVH
jgi:hypothetical protein